MDLDPTLRGGLEMGLKICPMKTSNRHPYKLNPRTAGGADIPPPLRFFSDSEKTAARSAAKFAIAVQPTI